MDTTQLRAAYAEFINDARQGGFGEPPDGEWSAEQVVAHVAVNDELVIAAAEKVIAGQEQAYYNHDAIDTARLSAAVEEHGDMESLTGWLESTSARVCDLLDGFDDESVLVPVHLVDGGNVVLDQPLPFIKLMKIQARTHLPNHLEQLRALRSG